MKHQAAEAITSLSAKVTAGTGVGVAGASTAKKAIDSSQGVISEWGLSEWGIVFGMAIAFLSWVTQLSVNWYFNSKRLEIEKSRNQQIADLAQASNASSIHEDVRDIEDNPKG